jgi:hypothetical protein
LAFFFFISADIVCTYSGSSIFIANVVRYWGVCIRFIIGHMAIPFRLRCKHYVFFLFWWWRWWWLCLTLRKYWSVSFHGFLVVHYIIFSYPYTK